MPSVDLHRERRRKVSTYSAPSQCGWLNGNGRVEVTFIKLTSVVVVFVVEPTRISRGEVGNGREMPRPGCGATHYPLDTCVFESRSFRRCFRTGRNLSGERRVRRVPDTSVRLMDAVIQHQRCIIDASMMPTDCCSPRWRPLRFPLAPALADA